MLIWTLAILFLIGSVVMGYTQGAIRVAFSTIGLMISAALAIPCAPILHWIFPLIGFTHKYVALFVSPIFMFLILSGVFKLVAAVVHRKADQFYRYAEESRRMMWERMNNRVGACLGLVNGLIYTVIMCVIISVFGYFAVQAGGEKSSSIVDKFFANAGRQLQETRMLEVVAPFNPSSEKFMDASDVIGLLYQNRNLQRRLENYPPFMSWADQDLYKEMRQNREFQSKLKTEENLNELEIQPLMQAITTNAQVLAAVDELDLKDLRAYLETGKSAKFEASPILGRWKYDADATLRLARRSATTATGTEWVMARILLVERYFATTLTCFYDKKARFEYPPEFENKPLSFPAFTNQPPRVSLTGTWEDGTGNNTYKLKLGKFSPDARILEDRITFRLEGHTLVYEKIPE